MTVTNICWALPLKVTKMSAGFSNFPARCVSPQQRRRLLETPPRFFLPQPFLCLHETEDQRHCCSQSPHLSIIFPVTRCLQPHHDRVPVLWITGLQEYCNHTASFHSVTAVIYWERRLYNPYSMPLRKLRISLLGLIKSCVNDQNCQEDPIFSHYNSLLKEINNNVFILKCTSKYIPLVLYFRKVGLTCSHVRNPRKCFLIVAVVFRHFFFFCTDFMTVVFLQQFWLQVCCQ